MASSSQIARADHADRKGSGPSPYLGLDPGIAYALDPDREIKPVRQGMALQAFAGHDCQLIPLLLPCGCHAGHLCGTPGHAGRLVVAREVINSLFAPVHVRR